LLLSYDETKEYWNRVFSTSPTFNPRQPLSSQEIENALEWLSENSPSVIDFGCGNGKALLRTLVMGARRTVGIDISASAISVAEKVAKSNGLQNKCAFRCGGVPELSRFAPDSFDSGILFNIIDNLVPEDALRVLEEFHRLIRAGGKVLLKLNDFVEPIRLIGEFKSEPILGNLYRDSTGLFFWDLSDEDVNRRVCPLFDIEKFERISLGTPNQFNRLYFMRKP
jgi:SAM-dependent methyltransferase